MLFDLDGNEMTSIPHKREYDYWRMHISDEDYAAAVAAIKERITGKEVLVSSFLPGHDWRGTPFEPLFYACGQDETHSGYFFGLIVWCVMMEDDDEWLFMPSDKDSDEPQGMKYWLRNR